MSAPDDERRGGRAWSDAVARRPGGYDVTWTHTVEGPDAQARFDALVLAAAPGARVLDLGCGDAAFTVRIARVAAHVTGVDFSEGMLALARERAGRAGAANVEFLLGHARTEADLPRGAFDLAYSRRGPNITVTVPDAVRPGGTLLGLHPLDDASGEARYAAGLAASGLEVVRFEGLEDRLRFPTLADLAGYLQRSPGMPDLRRPEHREELEARAAELARPDGGYAKRVRFLLWEARVPARP